MKKFLSDLLAILWFFGILLGTLLFMAIAILMILFGDIMGMIRSGFSSATVGFVCCFMVGLIFAITGWVPAFRKCYYKLPWLYPLSMIMTMHLYILSIAEVILAKGYETMNPTNHAIALIIMIIQIIVCRAAMCIYLKKNPIALKNDRVQ